MAKTNYIKVTAGRETVEGTAVSRTQVIPITGLPGLDKSATKAKDPAIVGAGMATGNIMQSFSVGGALSIGFRACGGVGMALSSLLGTPETPVQVGACMKVMYTGGEDSCKITADGSGDELTSEIGDLGSESGDASFGTTGTIDLTAAATDTVAELVSVIDAYSNYSAELVWGDSSVDAGDIISVVSQANERYVYLFFGSVTSGIYLHEWDVDLSETERPTLSIQVDGVGDNYLFNGCVASGMDISAALQGMVESTLNLLGFNEASGQTESSLDMPDIDPMTFGSGVSVIGGTEFTYIKKIDMNFSNGHSESDGYGQGSLGRQQNSKGTFELTGKFTLRIDTDSQTIRPRTFDTETVAAQFEFEGKELSTNFNEWVLFDLPFIGISENSREESDGKLDMSFSFEAFKKKGTQYDDPVRVFMLTADSAAY